MKAIQLNQVSPGHRLYRRKSEKKSPDSNLIRADRSVPR